MSNVTRMPNRSPRVSSSITRGKTATPRAANQNVNRTVRNAALSEKYRPKDLKINSGRFAYEKPASSGFGKGVGKVAGAVARGLSRVAGPAGALVGMTTPVGEGSDRPSGPLMSGNKSRGPGGGSLSAPARTDSSRSPGASNSRGPAGPSGPNSGPSRSGSPSGPSRSSGPGGPSGPNSGPSKSSSAPRGSERFAKGSLVMAKSAKKSYFSKDAMRRSRSSFGGTKKGKAK